MAEGARSSSRMSIDGAVFAEGEATHGTVSAAGDGNVKSLAELAEEKIIDDLASSLNSQAQSATFTCGGSIPFTTHTEPTPSETSITESNGTEEHAIPPVQLRFGADGKGVTLTLPGADAGSSKVHELLLACQPASFGRGGEEVLDDDYRKAGKLDREDFATNFCPYEAGIIDIVAQLLLPQTSQDRHMRSIKAELYKLNVYSAPSGKFKAHVDTPRSKSQIGSLVLSLPLEHSGGSLAVRHLGKEVLFDWSSSSTAESDAGATKSFPSIQWAAFYSDCEHEVHEVTSGHRLTLTYNLYVCRGQGHLAGNAPSLDPKYLPFYGTLKAALDNPSFLGDGDILGIWLSHNYAHTNEDLNFLPASLKGADLSIYEIAHALGLECELAPVITAENSANDYENIGIYFSKFYKFVWCSNSYDGNPLEEHFSSSNYYTRNAPEGRILSASEILWLNKRSGAVEAQDAYATYGNQPSMDVHYSSAAMFIRVPQFNDRGGKSEQPLLDALVSRRGWNDEGGSDEEQEPHSTQKTESEDQNGD